MSNLLNGLKYWIGNLFLLEYVVNDLVINQDQVYQDAVNDISIINQSENMNVYVNNVLLVPGQEFNSGGNFREINNQRYTIRFKANGLGAPVPSAVILTKTYKNLSTKNN